MSCPLPPQPSIVRCRWEKLRCRSAKENSNQELPACSQAIGLACGPYEVFIMIIGAITILVQHMREIIIVADKRHGHQTVNLKVLSLNANAPIPLSIERGNRTKVLKKPCSIHVVIAQRRRTACTDRSGGINLPTVRNEIRGPANLIEFSHSTIHVLSICMV